MKKIDLVGKTFNLITVLSFDYVKNGDSYFKCECKCGNIVTIAAKHFKSGATKSCGCYNKLKAKQLFSTHGLSKKPEYGIYHSIISRCTYLGDKSYNNYGGRGIKVCEEWLNSFIKFYADMGERPSENHSIERIDNNGNYDKNNCIWADRKTQSRNRRSCRLVLNTETGIFYNTIVEAAESNNISISALRNNLFYQKTNKTKFITI